MDQSIVGFAAILGAFFAIANPFSGLPFFIGYSSPLTSAKDKFFGAVLVSVTLWVGATIVLFAGHAVLNFFGISIDGLRVGGGFVILLSGLAMMKTQVDDTQKSGRSISQIVHDLVRRGHEPHSAAKRVHASSPEAAAAINKNAQAGGKDAVSVAIAAAASGETADPATGDTTADAAAPSSKPAASGSASATPAAASGNGSATATAAKTQPKLTPAAQEAANRRAALLSLMFPFAIPMVLGPGFMSTILIAESSNGWALVMLGYSIVLALTFVSFLLATPLRALFGTFGMNVLMRLMGLIIIILAFEIMLAGLVKLLPGWGK